MRESRSNGILRGLPVNSKAFFAFLAFSFITLAALSQTISSFDLPLYFEADKAQTEFVSRGSGYSFLISSSGVQLALRNSSSSTAAQMQFVGANSRAGVQGEGELSGKINYFVGSDSSQWQTGLPTFSKVQVAEIYPGINLVFHGSQRQLEYDFTIAPGASADIIKMHFTGVDKISIAPDGELVLKIGSGEIIQPRPEIYQDIAGTRNVIQGGYKMLDARTVAFEIGSYDHFQPLVIDPVLNYSTYFGGTLGTSAWAIALNTNSFADSSNGYIYIAGQTLSKHFFTTGARQTNFGGGILDGDAFVAKFSNPPTNLLYLTYLGGTNDEEALGLAVDAAGNAFVGGYTDSTNFPVVNALYPNIASKYNPQYGFTPGSGFVAELNTNGSQLIYSTYLGGSYENCVQALAIDSSDNAYVVGYTSSTNFPVWPTNGMVLQKSLLCTNDEFINFNGFVTEIASNDSSLVYSTYLGGTNLDVAISVAVDANSNVYVAGYTASTNFPVTGNTLTNFPMLSHLNGDTNAGRNASFDGFVTKFPPLSTQPSNIAQLVYSTYLGGTNGDMAYGVTADAAGDAYVTGWTTSTNFPVYVPGTTNGPAGLFSFLTTNGLAFRAGVTNAFLTKIAPDGSSILDSVVFGGFGGDIGYKVALDAAGNAFVVGTETSTNFPTTNTFDFLAATNTGGRDAFVTSFNTNWTALNYSVLIGGRQNDSGYGIALDSSDNAFITGETDSTNFPIQSAGVFSFNGTNFINGTNVLNGAKLNGTNDAFLAELQFSPPAPYNIVVTPPGATNGVGADVSFSVTGNGQGTPVLFQWQHQGATNIMGTNYGVGSFTNLLNKSRFLGINTSTLTITNIQTNDTGYYQIVISYGGPPLTTNVFLEVEPQPIIVDAPIDVTNAQGSTVNFSVSALGQPPLHYQWQHDGTNLVNAGHVTGVTTNVLTISGITFSNAGNYDIVITNLYGSTNATATLTVVTAPEFLVPLTNEVVGLGYTNDLFVSVLGASPFHYSWEKNGVTVTNGPGNNGHISGATNDTLILRGITTNDAGVYQVTVTNIFGSTNSTATLTVLTTPTFRINLISTNLAGGINISSDGANVAAGYVVYATSNLLLTPITNTWLKVVGGTVEPPGSFSIRPFFYQPGIASWPQAYFALVRTN